VFKKEGEQDKGEGREAAKQSPIEKKEEMQRQENEES